MLISTVLHKAMELLPQPVVLRTNRFFENQPLKGTRKCGIAALLKDTTNLPAASEILERRACKEKAESKISACSAPQYDSRGDSKGVRTKQHMQEGSCDDTLYCIFKNNRDIFKQGQEKI